MADAMRAMQPITVDEWHRDRTVIAAHSHNLTIALRTNSAFSSRQRFVELGKEGSHRLMTLVKHLRRELLSSGRPLASVDVLRPFIEVSRSEETTGPITGVALNALCTFLELRLAFVDVATIASIANAALGVRSEVADQQSHEAVLARILQVLKACILHPLGVHLPEETVLNIFKGCFSIAMRGKPSEILRHNAETSTNDMVLHIFQKVADGTVPHCFEKLFDFIVGMIGAHNNTLSQLIGMQTAQNGLLDVSFRAQVALTKLTGLTLAYTIMATLREKVTAPRCKPVLHVVQDGLCRAMLSMSTSGDNVVVVAQMLRTLQLAAMTCGGHIANQLLAFLLGVYLKPPIPNDPADAERREVVLESLQEFCCVDAFPVFVAKAYDMQMASPFVFVQLCKYLADQCYPIATLPEQGVRLSSLNQVACSSLLQMIRSLAARCEGECVRPSQEQHDLLQFKSIVYDFAKAFAEKPKAGIKHLLALPVGPNGVNVLGAAPGLAGEAIGALLFKYREVLDKVMLGEFISEGGLDPQFDRHAQEGETEEEFAARIATDADTAHGRVSYHSLVRKGFYRQFEFKNISLVSAMRLVLSSYRLPGEAQRIDRLMEELANQWYFANVAADGTKDPKVNPFDHEDPAFVFAFSIVMLNTDLHSPQIAPEDKMTLAGFFRNNRGINNGSNIPDHIQEETFEDIKNNEIKMKDAAADIASDDFAWSQAVLKSRAAGEMGALGSIAPEVSRECDQYLFQALVGPAIAALASITETIDEAGRDLSAASERQLRGGEVIIQDTMHGLVQCGQIAAHFGMTEVVDKLVITLCGFTKTLQPRYGAAAITDLGRSSKGLSSITALFNVVHDHGAAMRDSWVDAMDLVLRLYLLGCLPEQQQPRLGGSRERSSSDPGRETQYTHISQAGHAQSQHASGRAATPSSGYYDMPSSPVMQLKPLGKAGAVDEDMDRPAGGWFFSSGDEARRQQAAQHRAAASRVLGTIRDCQIANIIDRQLRLFPDPVLENIIKALIKISGVQTPTTPVDPEIMAIADPSVKHSTVFSMHLLADILVSNGHRYQNVVGFIDAFYTRLLVTSARHMVLMKEGKHALTKQQVQYWTSVGEHVVKCRMRILVRLAVASGRTEARTMALLRSLEEMNRRISSPVVFGTIVARHTAAAVQLLVQADGLSDIRAPEMWETLITLCFNSGRHVAPRDLSVTMTAFETLQAMAKDAAFPWPDQVPSLIDALTKLYAYLSQTPEDSDWEHLSPRVQAADGDKAPPAKRPGTGGLQIVETFTAIRDTLMECAASLEHPSPRWVQTWLSLLMGLAVVATSASGAGDAQAPPETQISKERSDALIALQRSVLSGDAAKLPVPVLYEAFTKILIPLVRRLCDNGASSQQSTSTFEAASSLLGKFWGSGVNPESPDRPVSKASLTGLEELQTRVLALMCKTFLHFTENGGISSTPNEFVNLWNQILGLLYAYHSRPPKSDASDAVRDSVCEQTKNLINVLASLPSPQLQAIPNFWAITRNLISPFKDLAPSINAHLDALGLPGAAGADVAASAQPAAPPQA
eukprot:TRINITY_DN16271_c0_g1_i1.p1 TRINITY_DN16271_c0_g1~~TRINITY_DN16271_c0_g1_i1.p1  ORF type:complete len:1552 (+),score=501.45 TRINITY_DN16271_c0_g1_i1:56-4711(+)